MSKPTRTRTAASWRALGRQATGCPRSEGRWGAAGRRGLCSAGGLLLASGAWLVGALGVLEAEAYRFIDWESGVYVPVADNAPVWSTSSWRPGETLEWRIARSSEWEHWYGSARGAERVVEKALEAWSSIPTADIAWRVAGVATSSDGGDFLVTIDPESESGGYARLMIRSGRITSCRVALGAWAAREPDREDDDRKVEWPGLSVLIHEFGHCLGLGHSSEMPGQPWVSVPYRPDDEEDYTRSALASTDSLRYWRDPQMSYGISDIGIEYPVTRDDAVAASLLRPARVWRHGTGSIKGQVLMLGEPLSFAHVWAFGVGSTRGLPDAVGAFSNREGDFLIEGLQPGAYVLWVSTMGNRAAHHDLVGRGAPRDLDESLRLAPILVAAGQTTETVPVYASRGRKCSPPAPCGQ